MVDVGVVPQPVPVVVRSAPAEAAPAQPLHRPSRLSVVVFAVAALVTAVIATSVHAVNERNEDRLLRLQTRQAAALLQVALPSVESPLASGAEIAAATDGSTASFRRYAASYVGPRRTYISMSLWRVLSGHARVLTSLGRSPQLATTPRLADTFLGDVAHSTELGVHGFLDDAAPRLGYAHASTRPSSGYVIYAESYLPPRHRTTTPASSPFRDLRFALYLGHSTGTERLLETNVDDLPMRGRTSRIAVPFGTSSLTLVASPVGNLGGRFAAWRWWVLALIGGLLAIAAGVMTDRLVKRRRSAESLAGEVEILLQDQRTIADSLQQALLPSDLPSVEGLQFAVRYLPGIDGIEIGGDWYDVISVDDTHFFFVVGDVSGRGLDAGSVMASLHFAIRAYATEGHDPAAILNLLTRLLVLDRDRHFATVLCGYVDTERRTVTVANAGHLPPLVVDGDVCEFVQTDTGPPIGVSSLSRYEPVTITMGAHSTLLAYTDGLVERRGEALDDGMRRLQATASAVDSELDAMLATILAELVPTGSEDDTALLGLRWM